VFLKYISTPTNSLAVYPLADYAGIHTTAGMIYKVNEVNVPLHLAVYPRYLGMLTPNMGNLPRKVGSVTLNPWYIYQFIGSLPRPYWDIYHGMG
jgi:hypothetical protein